MSDDYGILVLVPILQRSANGVVYGVKDSHLTLCCEVSLRSGRSDMSIHLTTEKRCITYHEHVDGDLLPLVLKVVDVCTGNALGRVR